MSRVAGVRYDVEGVRGAAVIYVNSSDLQFLHKSPIFSIFWTGETASPCSFIWELFSDISDWSYEAEVSCGDYLRLARPADYELFRCRKMVEIYNNGESLHKYPEYFSEDYGEAYKQLEEARRKLEQHTSEDKGGV